MRERYIKMRNSKQLDVGLLYTLAIEEGLTAPIDHFAMALTFANVPQIMDHLDRKFDVTILYNKNGEFIKIVD